MGTERAGYLVLRRNTHEKILMTGGIEIVVVEARNGWCRLGIRAPAEVIIAREEVADMERLEKGPN